MTDDATISRLCAVSKDYSRSSGLHCSFRLNDRQGDCLDCSECSDCRKDLLCLFCSISPASAALCDSLNEYSGRLAFDLCQPYIFQCPLGLTRWAVPIIADDAHLGTLIAGGVRISSRIDRIEDSKPPYFDYFELPWQTFTQAWDEVPLRTPQQVHYTAQQLFYSVCYAMSTDKAMLLRQQRAWAEQAELYEEVSRQKSRQARFLSPYIDDKNGKSAAYRLQLSEQDELELVGRIQMGDRAAYRSILNKALGRIFLGDNTDNDSLKAMLIELVISVGRIAFARQAPGSELFGLYYRAISELHDLNTASQICTWAINTFDRLADLIYSYRDEQTYSVVESIVLFIKQNYATDLTIDTIAAEIGYSPYYVSRLFKEELNITMLDYLTEVRVLRSKELLEQTELPISLVSELVGYKDSAYFSRLFKRRVGISPSEYRRWWQGR